ncbi:MAG: tRNA dihydrouridine synthase DusB, partial [Bacteroidales bacterium]
MVKIQTVELGEFPLWLSPMEDVTDPPFRRICKRMGADVLVTEFVSSEALIRNAEQSIHKLDFEEGERPLAIQIFGHDENSMRQAAEMAAQYKPDFIDINWGCPVKKVVSKGAGSGILQNIPKMIQITRAVVEAMAQYAIPVSVKTRLGWDETSKPIVYVAEALQDIGIAGLSIHGRTRAQMYKGTADWTLIGEVKNNTRMHIPIFGNGDIDSPQKAKEYKERFGLDGMMIGRAAIGYPWIFNEIKHYLNTGEILAPPTMKDRLEAAKNHLIWSMEWKGERLGIVEMR